MNLVARAKGMILDPAAEWQAVEREATSPRQVIAGYLLPLAALGSVVVFVVMAFLGMPVVTSFLMAFAGIVTTLLVCIVGALTADSLAPGFGGTVNREQAFKLIAYAYTPSLVAALIPTPSSLPSLGSILRLAALIYSIYLLYLGLQTLMKMSKERARIFASLLVVVMFATLVVVTMILGVMLITGSLFTDNPFRIV